MGRPRATDVASVEANMDKIALAQTNIRELSALRQITAEVYQRAGLLVQSNAELIERCRQENVALESRNRRRSSAA